MQVTALGGSWVAAQWSHVRPPSKWFTMRASGHRSPVSLLYSNQAVPALSCQPLTVRTSMQLHGWLSGPHSLVAPKSMQLSSQHGEPRADAGELRLTCNQHRAQHLLLLRACMSLCADVCQCMSLCLAFLPTHLLDLHAHGPSQPCSLLVIPLFQQHQAVGICMYLLVSSNYKQLSKVPHQLCATRCMSQIFRIPASAQQQDQCRAGR